MVEERRLEVGGWREEGGWRRLEGGGWRKRGDWRLEGGGGREEGVSQLRHLVGFSHAQAVCQVRQSAHRS